MDNYVLATMCGNFQDGSIAGKIQFGSGWWFLDQKEGMEWQINALSNCGLLSRFVGMLTDSRSFMSYPRHEYFRRVLCNLLGRDMESGELPGDLSAGRRHGAQYLLQQRPRFPFPAGSELQHRHSPVRLELIACRILTGHRRIRTLHQRERPHLAREQKIVHHLRPLAVDLRVHA